MLPELMPVLRRLFKQVLGEEALDESKDSLPKEYDDWIQELLGYIEPEMFIEARKQVGTLIVGQSIPKALRVYFEEIKDCYMFGQHLAAVGLYGQRVGSHRLCLVCCHAGSRSDRRPDG
ncbi:MAG: hypothetical protein HY347_05365 [candidate division NC10 bacterium]|nr:hypothetical protein [candidate division NC10 bacterium]